MKKVIFAAALLINCFVFKIANAQISVNLGINIGSQPEWGPVGYDHAEYYYMPDIDAYYSVPTHQYIYYQNNAWIRTVSLPVRYRNYDVYSGYKVVINDRDPWLRNDVYRTRYANYRGRRDQVIIRDSREEKYRDHWDNGKHKGWYKKDKGWKKDHGDDDRDHDKHHGHDD
ncbi:hypothetical protein G7092_03725 [Mucilaginibacter sp. HC2]|uniref:hypothetical protein n=1 Tax=Mucilaginibacter inviolabilis TaxID=2714892 RepID=UPI00140CC3B4|nr:hypothetical protein [Mucilaginibacter inviolabilis]NHA02885.1 hypothetical protein [Mucilaginibacter inviolabilis]